MYLSPLMMTDSMVLKHGVWPYYVHCIPFLLSYPTSFSNCTFPFEHIPSSHNHLYSILLTLLHILPLLTQLGCVYLPRFWLFCLFVYLWFGFLLFVYFVIWFSRCCWCSFVLQEQHVFPSIPTYHFWRKKKFEGNISTDWIPRAPNQPSSNAKKHCKQFVELARCERVMTTRAEFHFSWVYTFSATPRSLRIWATHPPWETGCEPAPLAQIYWSSSSSFPHICNTTSWN